MKTLGTILPTKETMQMAERFAAKLAKEKETIADRQLRGCRRVVVGGEVRYYDTTDQYAIVSRQGKVLWFAVRADGDYRIN